MAVCEGRTRAKVVGVCTKLVVRCQLMNYNALSRIVGSNYVNGRQTGADGAGETWKSRFRGDHSCDR